MSQFKFNRAFVVTSLAAALTGLSFATLSQTVEPQLLAQHTAQRAADASAPAPHMHGARHAATAERFAQRRDARLAKFKDALKIAPEQEAAWSAFVARTAPGADFKPRSRDEARAQREEWRQLSTPERLDRMEADKARRDAEMAKRHDAIRSLYAALTPEQQKLFDERATGPRMGQHAKHRGHGPHGMHKSGHPQHHRPGQAPAAPQAG